MHLPLRLDHMAYEILGILIENRLDRNLHINARDGDV